MMVAMLGILKAGGAYLPLDPGHPVDRTAFIVGDAGLKVCAGVFQEHQGVACLILLCCSGICCFWSAVLAGHMTCI
jgi:hypothetical protein